MLLKVSGHLQPRQAAGRRRGFDIECWEPDLGERLLLVEPVDELLDAGTQTRCVTQRGAFNDLGEMAQIWDFGDADVSVRLGKEIAQSQSKILLRSGRFRK